MGWAGLGQSSLPLPGIFLGTFLLVMRSQSPAGQVRKTGLLIEFEEDGCRMQQW